MSTLSTTKRTWLPLLLIVLVIIGPLLFAWFLVKRAEVYEFKKSNHGDLIRSPPNIQKIAFYDLKTQTALPGKTLLGRWWLVYIGPRQCYQECQSTLYNLKQIQIALGKEASRVDRLFIAPPECPAALCESYLSEFYPDLTRVTLSNADFNQTFALSASSQTADTLGQIYIIDPLGNIILHYSPEDEPRGILSDLKRLLKVSRIG